MKPTGWFQIAWSDEIPIGSAMALRYFGCDLAAFRDGNGALHVLDAHCRHLGAHLGHGGRVDATTNCLACPYHGWQWDGSGRNTLVPGQDRPSRARLRSWSVAERHGLVYLWHDVAGGPPREGWFYPDVFADFEDLPASADDYFAPYPHATVFKPGEPIHPQLVLENSADCAHFVFAHDAAEPPVMESFSSVGTRWQGRMAFISPKTKQPALWLRNSNTGIGVTCAIFDSPKLHYRLVLTATPVDDERSDLRVSYFYPRNGVTGDELPAEWVAHAQLIEGLFEEDARIWRHQAFVQKPVYAAADRAGYSSMRTWAEQFFEAPRSVVPMEVIEDSGA